MARWRKFAILAMALCWLALPAPSLRAAEEKPAEVPAAAVLKDRVEQLEDRSSVGFSLTVVGMGVVFTGLVVVYVMMVSLAKSMRVKIKAAEDLAAAVPQAKPHHVESEEIPPEVATAIGLALFMDLRALDEELADELTIKKITRPYSPWWNSGKSMLIAQHNRIYGK